MELEEILACPRCLGPLAVESTRCTCAACPAEYPVTDGIPRLAGDAATADERLAAEWTAQHHAHPIYMDEQSIANHWEEQVLPAIVSALGLPRGPVLDLGCGVGHLGRSLARAGLDLPLVGLDFQGELLAEARVGYLARVEADSHHLPLRDASLHGAIVANALHHLADPAQALGELFRVLAPGATLVAYDPRALAPLERVKKALRRHNHAFTAEHRAFAMDEYRALFVDAGFEVDVRSRDHLGALASAGLDLLAAGRLGVSRPLGRALAGIDRMLARADKKGALGLMLIATARR